MNRLSAKLAIALAVPLMVFAASSPTSVAIAAPLQAQGTDGADGANGANGYPGEDGQSGQAGGQASLNQTSAGDINATAIGGKGGRGGNGGNGVGGIFADGGLGGTGGTGGLAIINVHSQTNAVATATGGLGGNGGLGGLGSQGGLDGFGGFGGYGGAAVAEAHGVESAIATAIGGASGMSGGTPFSNSLRGGNVSATASATNLSGNTTVIARQYGGNGGQSGGRGANATMTNRISGGSASLMTAEQMAVAGNGGNGVEGVGGEGGAALSLVSSSQFNSLGGDLMLTLQAVGGSGGFSQDAAYNAGNAGNARVGGRVGGSGNLSIVAEATGGFGGNHLTGSYAGNGGRAFMEQSNLSTAASKSIDFTSILTGGGGGSSLLNTRVGTGKGGDAISFNAVRVIGEAQSVSLTQELFGGAAGSFGDVSNTDRYVGTAGIANGRIGDISNSNLKSINLSAFGGKGADFVLPNPGATQDWAGGNGGNASAIVYSKNMIGDTQVNVFAQGGNIGSGGTQLISPLGFLGFGGTALASGYADSGTTGLATGDVSVTTTAIGGTGLNLPALNGGGSAKSYATAIGRQSMNAFAGAFSASQNSSDGTVSRATARTQQGHATADANADGTFVGSTLDVLGSAATSIAFAETMGGTATSRSTAFSGNLQTSVASSTAKGRFADASAHALGGGADWSISGLRAGSAAAFATGESSDNPASPNHLVEAVVMATARGGDFATAGDVWGIGGNAKAVARGTALSTTTGSMVVQASATAGLGQASTARPGRDGFAEAIARGTSSATEGSAVVSAVAISAWKGRANSMATAGRVAESHAMIAGGGTGVVQSTATSFDANQAISLSKATLSGPSSTLGDGRGSLFAHSSTTGNSVIAASAMITSNVNATVDSGATFGSSLAAIGHHQTSNILGAGHSGSQILAHGELFPDAVYSSDFIASSALMTTEFSDSNLIYGMGALGHEAGLDGAFNINMQVSLDISYSENLLMGFFDTAGSGAGFETFGMSVMVEGNTLLSQSFGSLAQATAFFDNQIYDLGSLGAISGPLDLQILWSVNTTALDSFSTKFVFGSQPIPGPSRFTAVPEPGVLSLVAVAPALLLLRRRRESKAIIDSEAR